MTNHGVRQVTRATFLTSFTVLGTVFSLLVTPLAAQEAGAVVTRQNDQGGIYEGTFKDGVQHGVGSYSLPSGFEYTGEWFEGEIKGEGLARYPDGSVYEGAFAAGKPHGFGKITYADGGTYEGDWVEGEATGSGVATYANGVKYEGGFLAANHHGQGRMESPSGYVYEGAWVNGVKQGKGTITYPEVPPMSVSWSMTNVREWAF